jgi:hypothetical protein
MFYVMVVEKVPAMENEMPAKPTASIQPTMTSKGFAFVDPDKTTSTGRLLTVAEAARWLKLCRNTFFRLIQRRDLPKGD